LYNSAVALVCPSIYEGFGMPPLEAMAGGCPVISSNSSSMPEVVNNAGLYFDPCDLDDMRNAIETVCFSSELRAKLIKAGNENVKKFSWDKCAQKTLAIYEKLAGTK
ncbi:MAG: glycosyltransferase, partial [Proteobacteria bacterium]|nr:glycosyltransferase [Pseudomonadota bacterium]